MEFRDYRPNKPPTIMTLMCRTDQNVTLYVYRLDGWGIASLHVAPISISAMSASSDEQVVTLSYPVGGLGLRCVVKNTGGTIANVALDAAHSGQGATS